MAKAPERAQRRHLREKATIDHLVQDVYKPKPAGRGSGPQGMGSAQRPSPDFLTNAGPEGSPSGSLSQNAFSVVR